MQHTDTRRAFIPALIAIATLAGSGCGTSGAKPATQTAQAAAAQPTTTRALTTTRPAAPHHTFTSQRYGFRLTLTRDWSETDARTDWNGKKLQGLESPAFANFTDTAAGRTLAAGAAQVTKGMTLTEWQAAMVHAAPAVCADSPSAKETTLDGEPALAWTARCSDGYDVNKLAALHGTRGYMILLASQTANNDAQDRHIFESMRRSFHFTN
jgi:hypothetical protein